MSTEARWAIRFEGIGIDKTKSGATAWGYGEAPPTPGNRDWFDVLTTQPASIDSSVDPFTGEFALSAFVFELSNLDTVALTFLYQQVQAQDVLQADLTIVGTSITLVRTDLAGELVYLGMETILLGTHAGAGVYTGCTRAYHGSTATIHDAGRAVYTRPPKWRGRALELVSHNDAGAAVVRWRGLIERIETSDDGTVLSIGCRELWSVLVSTKTNRGANSVQQHGIRLRSFTPGAIFGQLISSTSARKQSLIAAESSPRWGFFQVGDGLFILDHVAPSLGVWKVSDNAPRALLASGKTVLDSEYNPQASDRVFDPLTTFPIFELFCVSKDIDARAVAAGSNPASATRGYEYPYHPLTIMGALMFGSESETSDYLFFDTATPRWSANLLSLFAQNFVATLDTLIGETRGIEVDFFLLGWDGKEVDIIKVVVTQLLRPYGFFLGVTTDGKLTVARFNLFDVVSYDAALSNQLTALTAPLQIGYDSAMGSAVDVIEARLGDRPWRAGRAVTLQATGGDSDRARLGDNQRWAVDYSTLDVNNIDDAVARVLALSQMGVYALPRLTIRVDDADATGVNLDHGALCTLADLPINEAYLVDADGNRISNLSGATEFAGIVIGRRYLVGPSTYEVTLLFTNFRGGLSRYRTPSLIVTGVAGSVVSCASTSQFGYQTADNNAFNLGDQVQFYDGDDLSLAIGTVYTITLIGTNSVTVSPAPSGVTADMIMELALYSNYTNRPFVTNTSLLAYNYMAIAGVLGTSDEAHTYGLSPD